MFNKEIKSNKKYEQLSSTDEDGFIYPLIDVLTVFDIQGMGLCTNVLEFCVVF